MRLTLAERNRQLSSAIAACNTVFETTERQRRAAVRNLSTSLHELLPLGARVDERRKCARQLFAESRARPAAGNGDCRIDRRNRRNGGLTP